MGGYYSYDPAFRLTRHVLVVGACGSHAVPATSLLTQRTGLAYTEVLRGIEHRAGRSITEVARTLGPGGMDRLERAVLRTALAEQPHLVAGADLSLDRWAHRRLLRPACVVFVDVGLPTLLARVRQDPLFHRDIGRHAPTRTLGEARVARLLERVRAQRRYAQIVLSGEQTVRALSEAMRRALLEREVLVPAAPATDSGPT